VSVPSVINKNIDSSLVILTYVPPEITLTVNEYTGQIDDGVTVFVGVLVGVLVTVCVFVGAGVIGGVVVGVEVFVAIGVGGGVEDTDGVGPIIHG
jgi:hypothetical protein